MIKLAIKCNECLSVLEKPVLLPCGSSVCCKHLESLQEETFFCKSCEQDHHIEENNKIVIKSVEILINSNLKNLNLGPEYNSAFKMCNELEETINEMKTLRNDPAHFIKQTINRLKNKTELIREKFKLNIDDTADRILRQLNNYEKECEININSDDLKIKRSKIDDLLRKLKEDLTEWQHTFNDFGSSENEWKTIKKCSNETNVRLKKETSDFKKDLLQHKLNDHLTRVSDFLEIRLKSNEK